MLSIFLVFIITLIIFMQLTLALKNKKANGKLPPGPIRWPVIGSIVEIASADAKYPHKALAKLAKKYGNIMGLGFGANYSVVLSEYGPLRDIMKMSETCEYRFQFPFVKDRSFGQSLGIIFSGGDLWRRMRRFTIRTLRDFGFGKKTSMEHLIREESDALCADILEISSQNDGIWDVNPYYLSTAALNILWTMVGGERFKYDDAEVQENIRLNEKFVQIAGQANLSNTFPFLRRWAPWLINHEDHMKTHKGLQDWIKVQTEDAKIKRAENLDPEPHTFIEVFLDEIEKNRGQESDFTEEQLVVTLLDLFLAGSETTSMTLNWVILFLTLNPNVQKKLQKEIHEATEANPNISIYDAENMEYLRAVLLEVSRLGNVVPLTGPRVASVDIEYEGFVFPRGTNFYGNLETIFQDEKYWGDPAVFRPERFLDKNGVIIPELEERVCIFGFGTRVCVGQNMAWSTLTMFLIELFGKFTFEPIKGREPSPEEPVSALTIKPRPYSVRVVPN